MTPQGPLVSILTPSLNQGRWLGDNVRSVATQTYGNVEHIVVDGGSTDATLSILAEAPEHVRWTSREDAGQSAALNDAFRMSSGEIVGWLNSDDALFHRRVLERVVGFLEARTGVGAVYGHGALVNADGLLLHYLWAPTFDTDLLRRLNFICQPTVFLRRSVLGKRFVDEEFDYTMDRELWLRLSSATRFERLDDVLAVDRHQLARKSYVRVDVARRDQLRLKQRYGVPLPHHRAFRNQLLKIRFRVAGVTLALSGVPELAFDGRVDSRARLLARQVARRRSRMPVGSMT